MLRIKRVHTCRRVAPDYAVDSSAPILKRGRNAIVKEIVSKTGKLIIIFDTVNFFLAIFVLL